MFGAVLTTAVSLMHAYVFWRAATVPFIERIISRKLLIGTGILLWIIFYCGRMYRHDSTGALALILEMFTMNWTAVLFLTSICVLAADLVTGFGFLLKKYAPALRGAALLAGALMSALAFFQAMRTPVVRDYEVRLAELPERLDGTVLVGVSDMHLGTLIGKRWLQARVDQINAMQPDLIIMLGDIFEGHGTPQSEMVPALRRFEAPLGVWAVLGNHEFYGSSARSIASYSDAGIRVLRNEWIEISPGFVLAGVDYLGSRRRRGQDGDPVTRALTDRPPGATVYLSHAPARFAAAVAQGADLMLAGHTHGGQVWPFGYLVMQEYPFLGGQHEVDGMTVIVSRGAGTWGPRMRLWRPGEIIRVTLRSKD
ncbi:MAG: metallophosphoesterase [Candidatus Glassbacteria bacterium]|nr:metallophosphoesterase [Candidatus Glassbacteria bacterium]